MTISENYRDLNAQLHIKYPSFGTSGKKWAIAILYLYKKLKLKSILDYGCGKQTLSAALPELNIIGYDPAIKELSRHPSPAELIVCGDVLEHIEPNHLDQVIDDLYKLTQKLVFIVLSTREAKKTLPDGRNAHLIVRPADWWVNALNPKFEILFIYTNQETSELVVLALSKKNKIKNIFLKYQWLFSADNILSNFWITCAEVHK